METSSLAKILLVDDRAENLFALEVILSNEHYKCVRACSGQEAINILKLEQGFALILMDVQMPVMDGFETTELIRLIENIKHIPVIFLTASMDSSEHIFKGYQAGAVDYMIKPITPEILKAKVAIFVDLFSKTRELVIQNEEKEKRAAELIIANKELAFQNKEKEKRAAELIIANKELIFQNEEKEKRAAELIIANKELVFQKAEKGKRAAELGIANIELAFQKAEKGKRAEELDIAKIELAFQDEEKGKRAAELGIANIELAFQDEEKEKRAAELGIANIELAFQDEEKEKRAAELGIANIELAFQDEEKEKRAAELGLANIELAFQNQEKEKRAEELIIANKELLFQNDEKEKRAAELIIANKELVFQNREKEKRAAELIVANEELIKAKEKFRLVVESAPTAMVLINNENLITLVNNQAEILFGYERFELLGEKLEILIPKRLDKVQPADKNILISKQQIHAIEKDSDLMARSKNGQELQVEVSFNSIETVEGPMVLVSIIDLTERNIQVATLKKQIELEMKNKELEQFAYIASHDLQEPLRTVSNYMQVFEEDYLTQLDDNARKYLHSVNSATKRMSMLIKSLLDFSRLGRNIRLTYVDCARVIDDVIADLETLIKTSNAVIEVGEMPKLNLYEAEIRQLFQNLITNAIKFRKKNTHPEIQIRCSETDGKWEFAVSDNGIGIAPAHFERIFDIFKRLQINEDEYEGNGIGLANCKKIIQLHKGDIWIESAIGQGTTFYFSIPNLIL